MKTILLLVFYCFSTVNSARILAILHVPTPSHYIMSESVCVALANKGHDVTIASPYKSKVKNINFREIFLDDLHALADGVREDFYNEKGKNFISVFFGFTDYINALTNTTLRNRGIQDLMESGEKFDVLMVEPFGNDALFGLAHIFDSHVIVMSTAGSMATNQYSGNVAPYSFVPYWLMTYSDHMNFYQRFVNTLVSLSFQVFINLLIWPVQKSIYEENFKNVPSFDETVKNVSLILINSHVVFETPRPYMPNMIPIGGAHIKKPEKLPQDLLTYLDNAKEGVIYFSLGSNLHSRQLSLNKQQAISRTFSKFPQKVLWKFEDDNLPNKPSNVRIEKWFPQTDILAHPNVKLFITHGGLSSTTETVFRGVPIVGVPVYGDQYANIANLVDSGYGQSINFDELDEESFTRVIKEVLENSSYTENVKRSAAILEDQPNKPLDRAVFWVEHVIRHNGACHLRSASVGLPLYQYLLLDVLGAISVAFSIFTIILYKIFRTLFCKRVRYQDTKYKKAKPKKE